MRKNQKDGQNHAAVLDVRKSGHTAANNQGIPMKRMTPYQPITVVLLLATLSAHSIPGKKKRENGSKSLKSCAPSKSMMEMMTSNM